MNENESNESQADEIRRLQSCFSISIGIGLAVVILSASVSIALPATIAESLTDRLRKATDEFETREIITWTLQSVSNVGLAVWSFAGLALLLLGYYGFRKRPINVPAGQHRGVKRGEANGAGLNTEQQNVE